MGSITRTVRDHQSILLTTFNMTAELSPISVLFLRNFC